MAQGPATEDQKEESYKNIGLLLVSTATLLRYGREIADLIYNQALLEETIKSGSVSYTHLTLPTNREV